MSPVISDKRLDIQGLRALAVALVVIFHLWPRALPGGFIGVDIFFVISGYLITAHLLREVDRTGTVSITRFWARRIRRLLPASFLVLAVCVVLAFTVMPRSVLTQNLQEIAASAGYFVNWLLAFNAVDYLASENADSLVQHYWSLSVEEQFYIVWPLLVVAAAFLATKLLKTDRRLVVAIALSLVFVASLIASIVITATEPAFAYFITPTRAWEFAAGGLIAMLPALTTPSIWSRFAKRAGSWLALAVVALSALVIIDTTTPFPGWIALAPVLATGFLLWAGDDDHPWSPQFVSHAGPVQLLGDTSYAIYLWHWPLIIAAPYVLGHGIGLGTGIAIIAVTIALSIATKYLVEDPVRRARGPLSKRWPAYAFMATGMIILISTAPITSAALRADSDVQQTQAATASDCLGAPAMDASSGCGWSSGDFLVPTIATALDDRPPGCQIGNEATEMRICDVGTEPERAVKTVAAIGDSHLGALLPGLVKIAKDEGWRLLHIGKGSCPLTTAVRGSTGDSEQSHSCTIWNEDVLQALQTIPDLSLVVVSASSQNGFMAQDGMSRVESGIEGYLRAWRALSEGVDVVAIRDVPRPDPENLECLSALGGIAEQLAYGACSRSRQEALIEDPLALAAESTNGRIALIDLSDLFCDETQCLTVIGNVTVYRDGHHITATFAESLAPYLRRGMGLDSSR